MPGNMTSAMVLLFGIVCLGAFAFLLVCVIRALLKYIRTQDAREEQQAVRASLGEVLRAHRMRCGMTQAFVADALGVSRQAVSKWENGTSDPSTGNLLALARLFSVSPEDLLHDVSQ